MRFILFIHWVRDLLTHSFPLLFKLSIGLALLWRGGESVALLNRLYSIWYRLDCCVFVDIDSFSHTPCFIIMFYFRFVNLDDFRYVILGWVWYFTFVLMYELRLCLYIPWRDLCCFVYSTIFFLSRGLCSVF